ncbi:MAG: hypothetical protein ACOH1I_05155 [Gallionellaceae bacterium]
MKSKVNQPVPDDLQNPGRRRALKLGAVAAAAPVAFVATSMTAQAFHTPGIVSPPTTPFLMALAFPPILPQRPLSDPAFAKPPTTAPNRAINPATNISFEGRGDAHQHRDINPPQFFFAQRYGTVPPASIHPELPLQINFWGSNLGGADLSVDKPTTPMPTIVSRYKAGSKYRDPGAPLQQSAHWCTQRWLR